MNKKILVTGADGQLGKTIHELFIENELGLDFTFVNKKALDITNKNFIKLYFDNNAYDYCINCAAYTNVEQAEKTPKIAFEVNAEGVKNLAEACYVNNIILIHISTDYVFDGKKEEPYLISDDTNPINVYGASKLAGENYIQEVLNNYFIVRTSWLYSKKYGNNFYRTIIEKAKTEKTLKVTTEQKGCPTDAVNLSKYLVELITKKNIICGIYHFCDSIVMTWYDFAKETLSENNLINKINLVKAHKYSTFANRPKTSILSLESNK